MGHAPHLDGITDTTTLFILSADTTTEDVSASGSWSDALLVIHQAVRRFKSGSDKLLAHGNQCQWRQ
jgi:hypothetical protein